MKSIKWIAGIVILALIIGGFYAYRSNVTTKESGKDGRITIKYIDPFTGGDGAYMKKITDGFNKSQDKYFIQESQEKDHYTKFKSGSYDLVIIRANDLETYKQDGLITGIDDVMNKAGLSTSDFHPSAVKAATLDGKMYGVPLDIHPLTMFYNKKLVSEPPHTYADLVKLNQKLQAKDKNLYALGVPSTGLVEFYMMTMAEQNGINLEKDGYLNFDQPAFADALMTFHDMIWKDHISPAGLGLDGEFKSFMKEAKSGNDSIQTAVSLTGPWFYSAAKEKYGDDLGIAPIPKLGNVQAVYGNSHTFALPTRVKDKKVLDGIAAFLKYAYQPEHLANWAASGQAPVHIPTMKYIQEHKDQYELAYQNQQQFASFKKAPNVYQYGEQMRYMNEKVFSKLVSTKDLTKEDLMKELKKATQLAKQVSESK